MDGVVDMIEKENSVANENIDKSFYSKMVNDYMVLTEYNDTLGSNQNSTSEENKARWIEEDEGDDEWLDEDPDDCAFG